MLRDARVYSLFVKQIPENEEGGDHGRRKKRCGSTRSDGLFPCLLTQQMPDGPACRQAAKLWETQRKVSISPSRPPFVGVRTIKSKSKPRTGSRIEDAGAGFSPAAFPERGQLHVPFPLKVEHTCRNEEQTHACV